MYFELLPDTMLDFKGEATSHMQALSTWNYLLKVNKTRSFKKILNINIFQGLTLEKIKLYF